MNKMKKTGSILMALVLMLALLVGCGSSSSDTSDSGSTDTSSSDSTATDTDSSSEDSDSAADTTASSETIKIGMMGPTSGDLAPYGTAVLNAANLAVDEVNAAGGVNGQQVELISYDNEGDPTKSINLFNRLVDEDGISSFVGPVISSTGLVVNQLAEEKGIPMITPTGTNTDITVGYDYVFRACYVDPYQGKMVAKFASENLEAKSAVIFENVSDDYSMGLAEAFSDAFSGEILADESYTGEDNDFKAIISKIAPLDPDVIFIPDYYNTVGLIAKQLQEAGVTATLLGGDGWDGVQGDYADYVEGDYFANHYATSDPSETVQDFIASYEDAYGEEPNALAALSYDAMKVMFNAYETAGSTDGSALVDALNSTDMDGVTGHITFDENGDTVKDVSIIQITGGELNFVTKISE